MGTGSSFACSGRLCTARIYADSMFCSRCGKATTAAERNYLARENERGEKIQRAWEVTMCGFLLTAIVFTLFGLPFLARRLTSNTSIEITPIFLFALGSTAVSMGIWWKVFKIRERHINQQLPSLPVPQAPPAPPESEFPCVRRD